MKQVLLIDDEPDFTELTGTLLGFHGFRTFAVNKPDEVLPLIRQESMQAIVTDLMMPQLDGLQLIALLRAEPRTAEVPIIALTAKILTDTERRTLLDHHVVLLTKPFEPHRLIDLIQKAVGE